MKCHSAAMLYHWWKSNELLHSRRVQLAFCLCRTTELSVADVDESSTYFVVQKLITSSMKPVFVNENLCLLKTTKPTDKFHWQHSTTTVFEAIFQSILCTSLFEEVCMTKLKKQMLHRHVFLPVVFLHYNSAINFWCAKSATFSFCIFINCAGFFFCFQNRERSISGTKNLVLLQLLTCTDQLKGSLCCFGLFHCCISCVKVLFATMNVVRFGQLCPPCALSKLNHANFGLPSMLNVNKCPCFSYSRLIHRHPVLFVLITCMISCILAVLPLVLAPLPDFSDPTIGFATRGTTISRRLDTWEKLRQEVRNAEIFSRFPDSLDVKEQITLKKRHSFDDSAVSHRRKRPKQDKFNENGDMNITMFCTSMNSMVVFHLENPFSYKSLSALCRFEHRLYNSPLKHDLHLSSAGERSNGGPLCQPWHLASIAAQLVYKENCADLEPADQPFLVEVIEKCTPYRRVIAHCLKSSARDSGKTCESIPENCRRFELHMLYNVLVPKDLFQSAQSNATTALKMKNDNLSNLIDESVIFNANQSFETLMILPVSRRALQFHDDPIGLYNSILFEVESVSNEATMVAIRLGIEEAMFKMSLFRDLIYNVLAVIIILLIIFCFTRSVMYTAACFLCIIMSLGVANFLYTIVFNVRFFPFINLLTLIMVIGIGADDAFILHQAWKMAEKEDGENSSEDVIRNTLSHASTAMFVTSATTAAAFFSNLLSPIVVLRCFGLFAGIAILCNYVFTILWLPAVIVLLRRYNCKRDSGCKLNLASRLFTVNTMREYGNKLASPSRLLVKFISEFDTMLMLIVGGVGLAAALAFFVGPSLQLPHIDHFQYFKVSHPTERWPFEQKKRFAFTEKAADMPMVMTVVWGLREESSPKQFEPTDYGQLEILPFTLGNNVSVEWMMQFCSRIAAQPFTNSLKLSSTASCFLPSFVSALQEQNCDSDRCCGDYLDSFNSSQFERCLRKTMIEYRPFLEHSDSDLLMGPLFERRTNRLAVVIVTYISTYNFSYAFNEMRQFYDEVGSWMEKELETAPEELKGAWFVIVVLLLTTRNVLVITMAMMTIIAVILTLSVCLVLLEWQLNVIESTTLTLATGLSFDYTLHYAATYLLVRRAGSRKPVEEIFCKVGSPVFMSMLTTAVGGLCMTFSSVYAYYQVGVFMLLLASISWGYATFLFLPMCSVVCRLSSKLPSVQWPWKRRSHTQGSTLPPAAVPSEAPSPLPELPPSFAFTGKAVADNNIISC
ncbi:Protein dispatched -like protein 1 [Trichinella pseudospiralis]|uniref:Protein dispatched-like protein 1 n=1 Tax=Trichinella pseudospiralis TaxID=6337 RepID=A0A0V1IK66_TRIPS|nr:Protein dispatched -like protein 1 [Trichinella pseudospiralis]